MLKTHFIAFLSGMLLFPLLCMGQSFVITDSHLQDTSKYFKDGSYEGKSRSIYTAEPFWGIASIIIRDGAISEIQFMIRDSSLNETFNENYENHFTDIPEYIEQCRNDWEGVQIYTKRLLETKDTNKIDAISGATWSYNIFKASVNEALKNAINYK
jgi:major membrane immunogen (membrane-anchored lipoprotein)